MHDNLKPTPENINKDKIKQIEREFSFDILAPKDSGIPDFINHYKIRVEEKIDEEVFGVINRIMSENGFENTTEFVINKSFVIDALMKATPRRPFIPWDSISRMHSCPECLLSVMQGINFCDNCGQKLDWSDEDA